MHKQFATVIATYSRRMRLRTEASVALEARIKGKTLKPVCGDRVSIEPIPGETDWLITGIEPRGNVLERPNGRGQSEILAANIDLLVVVAAVVPKPDWFIVDRYLCAAELMGARAAVIFNKSELPAPRSANDVLANYRALGYPVVRTSAETGKQVDELAKLLAQHTSLIVGQSGVGKSSLINLLSDASEQKISAISDKSGEGRHTTVNSVMLPLTNGGFVIDSPGVRDYAPVLQTAQEAVTGFREVYAAAVDCRFANCVHLREPGCAIKARVEAGAIDARRYESYRRAVIPTQQTGKYRH